MATIEISDVWKQYQLQAHRPQTLKEMIVRRLRGQTADENKFWALKDVSFDIERGETFGVIGNNGSGKSTLLKLITGISKPTKGRVAIDGRISALLELGAGFHPDFSGRENTFLNGAILGLKRKEIERQFESIVAFAELEPFIDNPVKTYSSGMYMRLAFSIAIHVDPDILVIDEVLAVGDAAFQQKCYDRIHRFKHNGKTIVFVSHSLTTVRELCQRVAWLDKGSLRALGNTEQVLDFYTEQVTASMAEDKRNAEVLLPSGRVTIKNIRALAQDGVETGILLGGHPASFAFEVHVSNLTPRVNLEARLFRSDGVCCFDQVYELDELASARSFQLTIPELDLHTGTYYLQLLALSQEDDSLLDDKFYNFAVNAVRRGPGVTTLGAQLIQLESQQALSS